MDDSNRQQRWAILAELAYNLAADTSVEIQRIKDGIETDSDLVSEADYAYMTAALQNLITALETVQKYNVYQIQDILWPEEGQKDFCEFGPLDVDEEDLLGESDA